MSGGGRVAACGTCQRVGRLQAKGMCPRCYEKSREHEAVCVDCGELRRHHRTGRCSRCYRLHRTSIKACARCGHVRRIWGEVCQPCKMAARAVGGACSRCRRRVARLWGGRCARCAKRHWTTGSCSACLAWASSIEGGVCRACREFTRHNTTSGACRSCGRQIVVNRYRRCRLCAASRREAHLSADPHWKVEPGARGGIQLFIGDLYSCNRGGAGAPRAARDDGLASVAAVSSSQLRLVEVPADPRRLALPRPAPVAVDLPGELAAAVAACAEARGWKTPTTKNVSRALSVLLSLGSLELTDQATDLLRRHRLPVTRLREFLVAGGWQQPTLERLDGRVEEITRALPERIREEVTAWVEALDGRWGRSQPRSPTTTRHYLAAVLPALGDWSGEFGSLREVTTDDVAAQLDGLEGSQRVITAVALRSLFAALKARRLVFVDPARPVSPGRFPQRPVLGLDDDTRSGLLGQLERADHRLVVLLAGVHALRPSQIIALQLGDVDLDTATLHLAGRRRPLDPLVAEHIAQWLRVRRERWPASANPHLLVSYKSAYGLGPISASYFTSVFAGLPTTAAALRADRLLAEAQTSGDPLRLARLFGLSANTAVRYCVEADPTLAATPG